MLLIWLPGRTGLACSEALSVPSSRTTTTWSGTRDDTPAANANCPCQAASTWLDDQAHAAAYCRLHRSRGEPPRSMRTAEAGESAAEPLPPGSAADVVDQRNFFRGKPILATTTNHPTNDHHRMCGSSSKQSYGGQVLTWAAYGSFLAFAIVLVLMPGAGLRRRHEEHPGRRAAARVRQRRRRRDVQRRARAALRSPGSAL